MYCMKNCAPRPGASRTQWASLGTMDQTNLGAEKIGNLSTVYSEAEPGSRASSAGEGNLSVIPHRGPSACLRPRGPTARRHVLRGGGEEEAREELPLRLLFSPQPLSVSVGSGACRQEGQRRDSGAVPAALPPRCVPEPSPEAAAAPGAHSARKPQPKNRKHLTRPRLVGRPVGARWRRRPPQAHSQYNVYSPAVRVGRAFECTFLHFF